MTRFLPLLLLFALGLSACDSTDANTEPEPIQATLVTDVPADPPTGRDPSTGDAIDTDQFTLFSLRTGDIVLPYDAADRSDSASTAWDIGFRGTTIIVNGGTSGPGEGAAAIYTGTFEELTEVPEDLNLVADGANTCPGVVTPGGTFPGAPYAICTGGGNGWYTYQGGAAPLITPTPGRVIVVRTADGRYAKVRILSYYRGNPDVSAEGFSSLNEESRYYTFEYVFQDDGTQSFLD
jgi:hypothetical protein